MKKFNLERALAGDPVVHANGHPIQKLIGYIKESTDLQKLIILDHTGSIGHYSDDGCFLYSNMNGSSLDLRMGEIEHTGFIHIYRNRNGDAFCSHKIMREEEEPEHEPKYGSKYICTIPITWTE